MYDSFPIPRLTRFNPSCLSLSFRTFTYFFSTGVSVSLSFFLFSLSCCFHFLLSIVFFTMLDSIYYFLCLAISFYISLLISFFLPLCLSFVFCKFMSLILLSGCLSRSSGRLLFFLFFYFLLWLSV